MELPHLGQHCFKLDCNKLDFLPIKCDECSQIFCGEHYPYTVHNCEHAYKKDNQVPVCPLCNIPIPVPQGYLPDRVVGDHIDNDCQSDPAKNKRKVFTNKCSRKGCKVKEVIPVVCTDCTLNFCLKHRHPQDHQCEGKKAAIRSKAMTAAIARQHTRQTDDYGKHAKHAQKGHLSEDEALARALALSMEEEVRGRSAAKKNMTQEELDLILAKQLQESEYQARAQQRGESSSGRSNNRSNDRCMVI